MVRADSVKPAGGATKAEVERGRLLLLVVDHEGLTRLREQWSGEGFVVADGGLRGA